LILHLDEREKDTARLGSAPYGAIDLCRALRLFELFHQLDKLVILFRGQVNGDYPEVNIVNNVIFLVHFDDQKVRSLGKYVFGSIGIL
jgi:hypothetical protein